MANQAQKIDLDEDYGIDKFNYNSDMLDALLANKVDKVSGKGLSTNDYTDGEKTKVSKILTTNAATTYLNGTGAYSTPPNTTYAAATTAANGLMTAAMVTKLNGIAEGATACAG